MASIVYRQYINSLEWKEKSRGFIKWTSGRCTLIPLLRASESHHMHYRNLGSEMIMRDVVPLSKFGHLIVHFYPFWNFRIGSIKPIGIFVNIYLRMACFLLIFITRPMLLIAALIIGYFVFQNM
jgi:hypothetical protein